MAASPQKVIEGLFGKILILSASTSTYKIIINNILA